MADKKSQKKAAAEKPSPADNKLEADREMLAEAQEAGFMPTLGAYVRMSGPGWLQSAITLGGGSLGSSLYLGVIAGFGMMWVQPLAMILGIIMLSAIGYVTVVTGERPFRAINEHVNPVLGWGWALAVFAANIVWCLPQYSLAHGAISKNLMPGLLNDKTGSLSTWAAEKFSKETFLGNYFDELVVAVPILILATIVTWSYDRGGRGLKIFETILKLMVAAIVLCFAGVVITLSFSEPGLAWGEIMSGFVPDFSRFFTPADSFVPLLDKIGPVGDASREFWASYIVDQQQDVIISAAATAVGINMTFLFAYSLLRKGWTREFSGLIKFDLATGMLIPFMLATSCVVIAAASQFHMKPPQSFKMVGAQANMNEADAKGFDKVIETSKRMENKDLSPTLSPDEKILAATLIRRDSDKLADALSPVTELDEETGDSGDNTEENPTKKKRSVADYIFGFGVLAMTFSTITILMLISGFVFTEIIGLPPGGWPHRFGTLLAGVGGALGPFIWNDARVYLVVPTSVFGYVLLPLAYLTFFMLMNQKSLLGDDAPRGFRRLVWNFMMALSASAATVGSIYMANKKAGVNGLLAIAAFTLLVILVHFYRRNTKKYDEAATERG